MTVPIVLSAQAVQPVPDDLLSIDALNALSRADFSRALDGTYEHSPWIAEKAWDARPFTSLAHLKRALVEVVRGADADAQLALVRAHPELGGKTMAAKSATAGSAKSLTYRSEKSLAYGSAKSLTAESATSLTAESTREQSQAGLADCTADELATLDRLNAAYHARFGFPFMLAVRGPRGTGVDRAQIIATFERRLGHHPAFEFGEALRNVHRVAELRLDDRFAAPPTLGEQAWDCAELLAGHSDAGTLEAGTLTVTYLTDAHRAVASQLERWMRECGFDEVALDAVGNVVGLYHGRDRSAPRLLTGSHYDTVRDAGKYDGRLGIFVPMVSVRELQRAGRRMPFGIEVIGFAEEEGQRYKAAFLGSGALTGHFDPNWLQQTDTDGISMLDAMRHAGLPATLDAIGELKRDPARYLGFVEVHIEQGPVLAELDLPLGVVTSINGSLRYAGHVVGVASHAGTTPMKTRRDAATAVAELALWLETRAAETPNLVGTMGMLSVPNGSINVVPGRCDFTLDIRATTDAVRDACAADVLAELRAICERRGVSFSTTETMRAAAAPSDLAWQARWERAVASLGLPVHRMPSGAGHDAMKLHEVMPQAMLFVRGQNAGISHNPLESTTADDMQLAIEAFGHLLEQLAGEHPARMPSTP